MGGMGKWMTPVTDKRVLCRGEKPGVQRFLSPTLTLTVTLAKEEERTETIPKRRAPDEKQPSS